MKASHYYSHTDLTLEIQEELDKGEHIKGYTSESNSYFDGKIKENRIIIETVQAARRFGKYPGTYITLEGVDLSGNDGGFHESMSECIAKNLKELLGSSRKILVVGLGNRNITPDALGPFVVDNLLITRPAFSNWVPGLKPQDIYRFTKITPKETQSSDPSQNMLISSAIAPGVMAQTGMETIEIIRGVVAQTAPEKIIVIDALAARSLERLNSTVQLSSTGIAPGSGVGNRRKEISEDTLGVPVIAVGVPTVISIPAVANDILSACLSRLSGEARKELCAILDQESDDYYRVLASFIDQRLFNFTMTPKDADESVQRISFTISEGINQIIANN